MWNSWDIVHDLPLVFITVFPKGYNDIWNKEESAFESSFLLKKKTVGSWPTLRQPTFMHLLGSILSHTSSSLLSIFSS